MQRFGLHLDSSITATLVMVNPLPFAHNVAGYKSEPCSPARNKSTENGFKKKTKKVRVAPANLYFFVFPIFLFPIFFFPFFFLVLQAFHLRIFVGSYETPPTALSIIIRQLSRKKDHKHGHTTFAAGFISQSSPLRMPQALSFRASGKPSTY